LGKGEVSLVNVGIVVSIAFIAIAALWITNVSVGQYISFEYWLLLLGVIGILGIRAFVKNKEK
jgi:hypothetical protein